MKNPQPLFDSTTHYRIEVQGPVGVEWLQGFDSSAEIGLDETRLVEDITVLNVYTDQAGIVWLVRRLHGLGIAILRFQILGDGGRTALREGD